MDRSRPLAAGLSLFRSVRGRLHALPDQLFRGLTWAAAVAVLGVFAISLVLLVTTSSDSLTRFGAPFVWGRTWNPVSTLGSPVVFGALPAIYGTLLTAAIGMLIGVPLSLGIAMFLTELAPGWLRGSLSFVIELLAAIPSVVYGIWGAIILVPYMRDSVDPALHLTLGRVPVLGVAFTPTAGYTGTGFLTAGVILAIMVIPTISAVTREAFLAVPTDQREAALSLGATRWETTRISVFPYARRGVLGAVTLGLGRAVGETIAVIMVIGNSYVISNSLFAPGASIAGWIAGRFGDSVDIERASLLELGLLLLAISLVINVVARLLMRRRSTFESRAG